MIAIYARQSIDKKDSISIDTQIEFCKYEIKGEEYKEYIDKGYSGKNTNRPAFENLMDDIISGYIDKVVVYRLDRISRSIVDFADFIDKLEKHKTSFISATEKFDTSAPMGRAMLYIVIVFAQLERETIAERVRDNYYERIKKGGIGGGPAPYGFDIIRTKIDGKTMSTYAPNDNIENVRLIFEEYSKANTSLADVQRLLIDRNILTTSGSFWDNTKLSTLLKSPAYVKADLAIYNYYKAKNVIIASDISDFNGSNGCLLVGKRNANTRKYSDVSNHTLAMSPHKGIIDSSTFLFVQDKLGKNKQIKNMYSGKYSWLTGLVKCAYCGYSFSIRRSKTKEGLTPYFCDSGRYLYKICNVKQTHRVSDVEDFVEMSLIEKVREIRLGNKSDYEKPKTSKYMTQIKDLESKIENLVLALENSSQITYSYINKRIESLDNEKQELLQKHTSELLRNNKFKLPKINDLENMGFEEMKELSLLLIKKVELSKDNIEIIWK